MTKQTKNYEKIKTLIDNFLKKSLDIDEVIKLWPNQEDDMTEDEGYLVHKLLHFQTDRDIHAKDEEYEKYERESIKELFDKLD